MQILEIARELAIQECVFVVNDRLDVDPFVEGRLYRITHANRSLLQFVNLYEAVNLIWKLKPNIILSTGSAPAVTFGLVAKVFSIKVIYIESFSRVTKSSLTGRIMQFIADEYFVQWPKLATKKKQYRGSLL